MAAQTIMFNGIEICTGCNHVTDWCQCDEDSDTSHDVTEMERREAQAAYDDLWPTR
jgi:hypothetical protein